MGKNEDRILRQSLGSELPQVLGLLRAFLKRLRQKFPGLVEMRLKWLKRGWKFSAALQLSAVVIN